MQLTKLRPEHDAADACYRVTAPEGFRYRDGTHERVVAYEPSYPGDRASAQRQAQRDAVTLGSLLEPCTDPDCEWCCPLGTHRVLGG